MTGWDIIWGKERAVTATAQKETETNKRELNATSRWNSLHGGNGIPSQWDPMSKCLLSASASGFKAPAGHGT
jgi:hypothetical protein